jgi:hypothetical protein
MKTVALIVGIAVLPLALAATAAATPPTTTIAQFQRISPHFLPCPGFDVLGQWQISRKTTTFYDAAGTAIRIERHLDYTGMLSNPLTGKSLPDAGNVLITVDVQAGTVTTDGKGRVDTVAGLGVVLHESGMFTFLGDELIAEAGQHDTLDGNLGPLCDYLSTP